MGFERKIWEMFLCVSVLALSASFAQAESYTLERAVKAAQVQDPWLIGSMKRQESLEALSIESGSLPDPSVSLGIANLPIDTFDFSQVKKMKITPCLEGEFLSLEWKI